MNDLISFLDTAGETWFDFIVFNSFQIVILFILVYVSAGLFRKKHPVFLYSLWGVVLAKTLLPPKISIPFFSEITPVYDYVPVNYIMNEIEITVLQPSQMSISYQGVLFSLWFAVVFILFARLVYREFRFRRFLKNAVKQDLDFIMERLKSDIGYKREINVYSHEGITMPFVTGFFKPAVYIPEKMVHSPEHELMSVLAHETAHIKRRDVFTITAQTIVEILYFFHPFVRIAGRFLNMQREMICDNIAISTLNKRPAEYGQSLLNNLEACLKLKNRPVIAGGILFSKKALVKRFEYIFNRKENVMLSLNRVQKIVILVFTGIAVVLSCTRGSEKNIIDPGKEEMADSKKVTSEGEIPRFLSLEDQPRPVGGPDAIRKLITYPEEAQKNGIEGRIRVKALVGKDGIVINTEVTSDSSGGILSEPVVNAIKQTKFIPAKQFGEPVKFWYIFSFRFKINEGSVTANLQNVIPETSKKAAADTAVKDEIPPFLPLEDQPRPVGGADAIRKLIIYPDEAQRTGIEGLIRIKALVNTNGKVDNVVVTRDQSKGILSKPVVNAIKKVRFIPAEKDGEPVRFWYAFSFRFKFNDKKASVNPKTVKNNIAEGLPPKDQPRPVGGTDAIRKLIKYPEEAQRAGIEGMIRIRALINTAGNVEDVVVVRDPSKGILSNPIVNAIKKTKFISGTKDGRPVRSWYNFSFRFKFNKDKPSRPPRGKKEISPGIKLETKHPEVKSKNLSKPDKSKSGTVPVSGIPLFLPLENHPKPVGGVKEIARLVYYPELAQKTGLEGKVTVKALILENGSVNKVKVIKDKSNGILAEPVIKALKKVRFKPAELQGEPVRFWYTYTFNFKK